MAYSENRSGVKLPWGAWVLAAIGGAIILVGAGPSLDPSVPLPPDAGLKARFREHRKVFDALATMAVADTQLVGAAHDGMLKRFDVFVHDTPRFNRMLTDEEVRATGRSEFRRLLDRAGMPAISRSRHGDAVWFTIPSRGGRAKKGIVYSTRPLSPVRKSLDGLERTRQVEVGYVPLAPRWYLFLHPRG